MNKNISIQDALTKGAIAGLVAAVINSIIFLIGSSLGWIKDSIVIKDTNTYLTLSSVILSSFFPAVVAGVVYYLLSRYTKLPKLNFLYLSVLILILAFSSPWSFIGATSMFIFSLELMHIVVAAAVLWMFGIVFVQNNNVATNKASQENKTMNLDEQKVNMLKNDGTMNGELIWNFYKETNNEWYWDTKINNNLVGKSSEGFVSEQSAIMNAIKNGYTGVNHSDKDLEEAITKHNNAEYKWEIYEKENTWNWRYYRVMKDGTVIPEEIGASYKGFESKEKCENNAKLFGY
jgi:low affinity Fe/Cu permease/uncharacterized protein YegP (UPF0339 family)